MLAHTAVNFFTECSYPKGYDIAFMVYGIFLTSLFVKFYRDSYLENKQKKAAAAAAKKANNKDSSSKLFVNSLNKKD